jgi:phage terminase small subunit
MSKATQTAVEPPEHLSKAMQNWWRSVLEDFALEASAVRILQLAAEAYDRCQRARESLEVSGDVFVDRWNQPKARPETIIARDSAALFARLCRELNLDVGDGNDARLPRPAGRYR